MIRIVLGGVLFALVASPATRAGESSSSRMGQTEHAVNLELAARPKRSGRPATLESTALLDLSLSLEPFAWPKNSDIRARMLTPELKSTPLLGWIAENLYRSKRETGWCLEVDPGEGEYIVLYRLHLR